jgi:hypothetical protein
MPVKLRKALLKFVSKESPKEIRLKAAQGLVEMDPTDLITVLFILSYDLDEEVSRTAKRSFEGLPSETILKALEGDLDPLVIKKITTVHRLNGAVLKMVSLNENTDEETPEGKTAIEEVSVPERAKAKQEDPAPKPKLQVKKEETASEYMALQDAFGEPEQEGLLKQIDNLTVGQKIKLALTGDKEARILLLKDSNKQITANVLKNPRITEDEILKLSSTKGTPDELLRLIAANKEWMKNYKIKNTLVLNPRTPLRITIRLITKLKDKDLANISKSKNIPSVLASAARKTLEARKKH